MAKRINQEHGLHPDIAELIEALAIEAGSPGP
jgi:hypothetical protein